MKSLSLSTRMGSAIMINPPVTEDLQLQKWYNKNKTELKELLQKKAYKDTEILLPYPEEKDIVPIAKAIANFKYRKATWIRGRLRLPTQDRSFSHTACSNCLKSVEADMNWKIKCQSCKMDSEIQVM
uniref:Uncharacterized protein n=1 Tax=Lactuca sativa TaxID=4236 RepID=A0A9R1WHG4_LACSA|nr:hypothetical protein LSAT_V11C200058530 [Lactuca sativa]